MILDKVFSKEEITTLIESIKREIDLEYLTDDYHGQVFDYIDNDDNDLFNAIEAWRINPNVLDLFPR